MANKNKLRHKNSKSILKTGLILISVIGVITFLIISYLIYSLQCYAYDNNISSDNLNLSVLIKSMPYWTNPTFTAPFDIGAIMQMHGSVWYIYVVALSLLALMLFSKNYDDYKGVEAGSAIGQLSVTKRTTAMKPVFQSETSSMLPLTIRMDVTMNRII